MTEDRSSDQESPRLKEVEGTKMDSMLQDEITCAQVQEEEQDSHSITTIDEAIERAGFGVFQHKLILICVCVFMGHACTVRSISAHICQEGIKM